jgi:hypothetical protein
MGRGIEVLVRGGRLVLRVGVPIPAMWRGMPLQPDDPEDPDAFRLDLDPLGMAPVRVVFGRDAATGARAIHTDLGGQPISFVVVPSPGAGPSWATAGAIGAAVAGTVLLARRRGRR